MSELLNSLIYSAAGLTIGFIIGYATGRAARKDIENSEDDDMPNSFARQDEKHQQRLTSLGLVVIVLSVLTVTGTAFSIVQQKQQQQCFNDFNVKMARSYVARSQAGDEDRKALNNLIVSLNVDDPAKRRQVYLDYIQNLQETDKKRQANPVPAPPNPDKYCER